MKLTRRQLRQLIQEVYRADSPMYAKKKGINPKDFSKLINLSKADQPA